ncbi:MAG: hypothetical protein ABIH45_06600 [Candidatus Omnitrophota bacterium]
MKSRYRYIVFLLVFLLVNSFFLSAQNLSLIPRETELISQKTEEQEGLVTSQHIYSSDLSKSEILKFYRQMFANQDFGEVRTESPLKDSQKATFFFSKQKEGLMMVLNFSGLSQEGSPSYSIVVHKFSLEKIGTISSSQEDLE